MILAGDIGGTKTVVALLEAAGSGLRTIREESFSSPGHAALEEILDRFLTGAGPRPSLAAACFGVAGPVVEGKSQVTNLPWAVDERELSRALQVPRVKLLNDLEAAAYGMLHLSADDLCVLQPGLSRKGNIAVIAAGTGLGEAFLYWDGQRYHPIASEGGHADFAPRSDPEAELLAFLRKEFGHVSYERVLSGPGLFNIYRYLRDSGRWPEPPWLTERLAEGDPSAVVSEAALAGSHPLCVEALELFVAIYGAEAGNMALKTLALGGVFVGGGIAPRIRLKLTDGRFVAAFRDKGRFSGLLASIPVQLALNARTPVLGAAHVALELSGAR
jgi:glucokinase